MNQGHNIRTYLLPNLRIGNESVLFLVLLSILAPFNPYLPYSHTRHQAPVKSFSHDRCCIKVNHLKPRYHLLPALPLRTKLVNRYHLLGTLSLRFDSQPSLRNQVLLQVRSSLSPRRSSTPPRNTSRSRICWWTRRVVVRKIDMHRLRWRVRQIHTAGLSPPLDRSMERCPSATCLWIARTLGPKLNHRPSMIPPIIHPLRTTTHTTIRRIT
jgi:hypothetical protein